jgi:hypothetical protein
VPVIARRDSNPSAILIIPGDFVVVISTCPETIYPIIPKPVEFDETGLGSSFGQEVDTAVSWLEITHRRHRSVNIDKADDIVPLFRWHVRALNDQWHMDQFLKESVEMSFRPTFTEQFAVVRERHDIVEFFVQ